MCILEFVWKFKNYLDKRSVSFYFQKILLVYLENKTFNKRIFI